MKSSPPQQVWYRGIEKEQKLKEFPELNWKVNFVLLARASGEDDLGVDPGGWSATNREQRAVPAVLRTDPPGNH